MTPSHADTATAEDRPREGRRWLGRWLPYFAMAAMALWMWWPQHSGPASGAAAADFDLPLIAGGESRFRLADQRGSPVLIEVFASWCGVCRSTAPTLGSVAALEREQPVRVLAVSVDDDPAAGAAAARDWGMRVPVAHADAKFARDYGIAVLPTFILVDASGVVREVGTGAVGERRLERWLAGVGAARR